MRRRWKILMVVMAVLIVFSGVGYWIFTSSRDPGFAVLNEVNSLLSKESVFREKLKDKVEVTEAIFELFFIYLNVPLDEIPDWARQEKERAIQRALASEQPVDYSFLNKIFKKLTKEEKFSYLKSSEEKFRLIESCIQGFINSIGDPFATYANPVEVKLGIHEERSKYEGVGVTISLEQGKFVINSVLEGSPAEKAGLQVGDIILKVNGKDPAGYSVREFILFLKSLPDPEITLTIQREGEIFDITVVRGPVKQVRLATFPSFDLPDGGRSTAKDLPYNFPLNDRDGNSVENIVYIRIQDSSCQMVRDLYYVLSQIEWEGQRGIIIDLRENPGGYLHSTLAAISYFLQGGELAVMMEDYKGNRDYLPVPRQRTVMGSGDDIVTAHPGLVPKSTPLVILIGSKSASGAEVFTAALRDNGRATTIGKERSAGKGTVNNWFLLRGGKYGALYIAISLWRTPNGEFIEPLRYDEKGGLLPEVLVEWTENDYFMHGQDPNWDPEIFAAFDIFFNQE